MQWSINVTPVAVLTSPVSKNKNSNVINIDSARQMTTLRNLSFISGGEAKMIFLIAKIITVINDVEKEDSSRVILIDEIESGIDKSRINALYETMKSIDE